ncbi:MAG: N-carbamoyl-D-amino-acid hydrolase [Rhodospirillaceae bacterium]|nr:N-carbamoyl-D-amino-acid hydrolase [Rhodospirillaceae bacterium]
MSRIVAVAAAQLGPIARDEPRASVVARMIALMREAAERGADLVVYPELALTTFFPRWLLDEAEVDTFFEAEMPGPETRPLFEEAASLGVAFHLGYAELVRQGRATRRFNTAVLVDETGAIVGKYRKVHLPGHAEHEPEREFQHLEKRYFEVGNLGFPVWEALGGRIGMLICNDRRWPEAFRVLGLQGVELVLIGYNTPALNGLAFEPPHRRAFHNHLTMQAGAYQNGTWVVGVAKAGREEGVDMLGGSAIVSPNGEIVAQARSVDDEVIVAACDLDDGAFLKSTTFDFAAHRRTEHYGLIVETTGLVPPRGKAP